MLEDKGQKSEELGITTYFKPIIIKTGWKKFSHIKV